MKNIVRILSVLILASAIVILLSANFDMGKDFASFANKVSGLLVMNILPILSIALCSYCLERNDTNYLTRIIPFYMSIPIILSIIMTFFDLGSGITGTLSKIISFMSTAYLCLTILSLLLIIKPNNQVTKIIKFISYAAIAVNVVLAVYIQVKSYMVDKLPNVYEYDRYGGFNFSTVGETEAFANKIYTASVTVEVFSIILLFFTNYGFSSKIVIDTDEIDYDKLKEEALEMSRVNPNNIDEQEEQPQNDTQQEKGLMNISNQLGNDSIVGKVDKAAKEVKIVGASVEDFMPMSHGPVINNNVNQNPSNPIPNQGQNFQNAQANVQNNLNTPNQNVNNLQPPISNNVANNVPKEQGQVANGQINQNKFL